MSDTWSNKNFVNSANDATVIFTVHANMIDTHTKKSMY